MQPYKTIVIGIHAVGTGLTTGSLCGSGHCSGEGCVWMRYKHGIPTYDIDNIKYVIILKFLDLLLQNSTKLSEIVVKINFRSRYARK